MTKRKIQILKINNNNTIQIHLNNTKQHVHHKAYVKTEILQVPQIKSFTPLHQITNYVPIPGMHAGSTNKSDDKSSNTSSIIISAK